METIFKIIEDCEVKKVGERQYEFIASTSTQDRDGEVIDAAGWDLTNFKKNPVVMYVHNYGGLPIGRVPKIWLHSGKLKDIVEFPPQGTYEFADIVERLVDTGYLKTQSVGFIPREWEDGDGIKSPKRTYIKQELLEISIVPIPSNPDALREAVGAGVITTKQFETITKPDWSKDVAEVMEEEKQIYQCEDIESKVEDEIILKPEETDDFIHIPVRDAGDFQDGSFRTIDIDKKKGIQAVIGRLKGETTTTVQKYIFDKAKGWTMAKAQAWVKEHEKSVFIIENIEPESKGAIPYKRTSLADEGVEWDAAREVASADVDDLKVMCAIVEGDPENKTSYKLPHHRAGGEHACVWRGVAASAAVLMGARGGVDAPAASIAGAKAHIAKHYDDFDKGNPPWEKTASQEQIKDEVDYLNSLIVAEGISDKIKPAIWILVQEILRLSGNDIPVDIKALIKMKPTQNDILEAIKRIAERKLGG